MPLTRLYSAAFLGLHSLVVDVEVDLTLTPGTVRIVGLGDAAVRESKDRVLHAIKNSGHRVDALSCTVHLAPAEIKKVGAFYDLPIAIGLLAGLNAFPKTSFEPYLMGGELGLSGELRPISGALALALLAKKLGKKGVLLPFHNAAEAALVPDIQVIPLHSLSSAIDFFNTGKIPHPNLPPLEFEPSFGAVDMSNIKGQLHAKRALEIAATGNHNVLLSGPPGTGKTLLAKAFSSILPPLDFDEAVEVTNIYSLAGLGSGIVKTRPFRSPHHTISFAGMVGGGSYPKPGEISLAHKGVLFLDELPEFSRTTLEVLRQPLEDKQITVSRAGGKVTFPTDVIFLAAMNPCPCGFLGHPDKPCKDTSLQIERYRQKISGPLLDRMDLKLTVPHVPFQDLTQRQAEEPSAAIRERVIEARRNLPHVQMDLSPSCESLLCQAVETLSLSARSYKRLLHVAKSIAALQAATLLTEEHLAEALSYHML